MEDVKCDRHPTHTFHQLADIGMTYFRKLFKGPRGATVVEIVRFSINFPRFLDQDAVLDLIKPISIGELEITPKWFKRIKSMAYMDGLLKFIWLSLRPWERTYLRLWRNVG